MGCFASAAGHGEGGAWARFLLCLLLCHFWQLVKGYCAVWRAGMWACEGRRMNRAGCACGLEAEGRSVEWAGMLTRKGTTVIGEIKSGRAELQLNF